MFTQSLNMISHVTCLKPLMSILLPCKIICISSFVCSRSVTTYLCYNLPLLQLTCVTTYLCYNLQAPVSPTVLFLVLLSHQPGLQFISSSFREYAPLQEHMKLPSLLAQFCSQSDDCSAHSMMSAAQCHSFVGNGNTINVNKQCIYEKWIYLCTSIQHTTIWRKNLLTTVCKELKQASLSSMYVSIFYFFTHTFA